MLLIRIFAANIQKMFELLVTIFVILAVCLLFMGFRVLLGKPFVHTHIDGNKPLNDMGINCVNDMERAERKRIRKVIKE